MGNESGETNGKILRRLIAQWPQGGSPDACEWSPQRETEARLADRFHGLASVQVIAAGPGRPAYHVCVECAQTQRRLLRVEVLARMQEMQPGSITAAPRVVA